MLAACTRDAGCVKGSGALSSAYSNILAHNWRHVKTRGEAVYRLDTDGRRLRGEAHRQAIDLYQGRLNRGKVSGAALAGGGHVTLLTYQLLGAPSQYSAAIICCFGPRVSVFTRKCMITCQHAEKMKLTMSQINMIEYLIQCYSPLMPLSPGCAWLPARQQT